MDLHETWMEDVPRHRADPITFWCGFVKGRIQASCMDPWLVSMSDHKRGQLGLGGVMHLTECHCY